jgi:hypothetical protein
MIQLHNTDAIKWAAEYDGPLFHALLADAPYHLTTITKRVGKKDSKPIKHGKDGAFNRLSKGFMGNTWDGGDLAFRPETWEAFLRVLYPGAFGMAFASSRGWHRMAVAIEDAGFIIHPTIFQWCYSSGFPKATNPSKLLRSERGVVSCWKDKAISNWAMENLSYADRLEAYRREKAFQDHRYGGQVLKPAVEPIIVFQKPYEDSPLEDIVRTGAGTLNIEAGRIGTDNITINRWKDSAHPFGDGAGNDYESVQSKGRWPSNLILGDQEAADALDKQAGKTGQRVKEGMVLETAKTSNIYGAGFKNNQVSAAHDEPGGASQFFYQVNDRLDEADPVFYCAKAARSERESGLEGLESREQGHNRFDTCANCGGYILQNPDRPSACKCDHPERQSTSRINPHPTVKPIDLCRYLASLLLPPSEYYPRRLFVPFSGVASECIGAHLAGWEEIHGVESDTENGYIEIAERRIEYWTKDGIQIDLFTSKTV